MCTDGERVKQQDMVCIVQGMLIQGKQKEGGYDMGGREREGLKRRP